MARPVVARHEARCQPLPGLGAPKGHGGRSMLPESQQLLQRPPCLPLWAGQRRFEQSSWVHLTRSAVAPQLKHLGSISFICV
jgi:hypothetical protein